MTLKVNKQKNQKGLAAIVAVLALFALVGLGLFIFLTRSGISEGEASRTTVESLVRRNTPTPTPQPGQSPSGQEAFPFQELTIPYLRSRSYESSLGELRKLSENANYTSYLTSYNSDGLKVNGLLTIPNSEEPEIGWSAIVFVHGYIPPEEYRTTQNYSDYVDYLARNGFVVFKIDLRGHGESEGIPGGGYYSGDYIIDTLNAHAALKNADFVNSDAIGLWGHSMSGNVVFRSFVSSDEIPAVVIWAGAVYTYTDFSEYRIDDNSYRPPPEDSPRRREREELFETYGAFDAESEFWSQVPATNYLEGVDGAVQINHATNDPVVDIRYSRNVVGILDDTSITHELNEYQSGGHNITGSAFNQAMRNTVEFFEENLK